MRHAFLLCLAIQLGGQVEFRCNTSTPSYLKAAAAKPSYPAEKLCIFIHILKTRASATAVANTGCCPSQPAPSQAVAVADAGSPEVSPTSPPPPPPGANSRPSMDFGNGQPSIASYFKEQLAADGYRAGDFPQQSPIAMQGLQIRMCSTYETPKKTSNCIFSATGMISIVALLIACT